MINQNLKTLKASNSDRGAVLITVLLIVAVMAAVAVALVDDIRFGIRRASNISSTTQANWYALGSEALALSVIDQTSQLSADKTTLEQPWATNRGIFPIDGGSIATQLADGSNCFNVNSLVEKNERSEYIANVDARKQFRTLLEANGVSDSESETISGAITDWIDSDSRPVPRGAEDFDYTGGNPAYRPPNHLISDITELRAIKGIDLETYTVLKPLLCALPNTNLSEININTLTPDQASLITMIVGKALKADTVATVLGNRPASGFDTLEAFWSSKEFEDIDIDQSVRDQVKEKTAFFTLTTTVIYGDAYVTMTSLISAGGDGNAYIVSRQFGEEI
ncbi:type II secretion system minor pseudopilin GspK [Kordiimonas sp. SCSIO 12610]|uniref:type II secretion system minor pseudopilin GspK n=1 Tax=Kordiimonas sp. SCSIO 12610 TaxID=2829597 RepID=UPI002108CFA9|nr:type II secretion system minor pseudopilin GspK [Kordiimonas sp. SCSIO 12610]UTW56523.1 type II secretion system minor pseudopilin GspK [Kordiimonas sp. SCSIO 12610]